MNFNFLASFGLEYASDQNAFFWLIFAWVAVVALRAWFTLAYAGLLKKAKSSAAHGIADAAAIDHLKPAVLRRAARYYAELGERGIARIDSVEIVRKSTRKLKVMWWSFDSAGRFLDAMDWGLIIAGILFTILANAAPAFAAATLVLFIAGRLFCTFFDYKQARDEFYDEMAHLLDRDIGKLYVTDVTAAINNFRTELKGIMTYQAQYLSNSINEMRDKLAAVSEETLSETANTIRETLQSVAAGADTVLKPLEEWRVAIGDSKNAHEELNISLEKMSNAADSFKERVAELDRLIEGYKAEFLVNNKNVESSLLRLGEITERIAELTKNSSAQTEAVQGTLEFVRDNQTMLSESMNQYEIALKDISAQTGEGLGKIIEYHTQNSYKTLTENAVKSVQDAGSANTELMSNMQGLVNKLIEQSQSETSLILNLKEQIELELSGLKKQVGIQKNIPITDNNADLKDNE
ncbi:MAG: hypothetical protein FWC95_05585 [Defluviitaleaceae bacterium]|nr:hypothetical protein [Defluviitaleaceae bacterium]